MAVLISAAASQAPSTKYINHTVGDNAGWFFNSTTNTTATNYSSWAGSQTFSLGDYLSLSYFFSDASDGIQCQHGLAFEINVNRGLGLPPSLNQPPPPTYREPPGPDSASPPVTIPAGGEGTGNSGFKKGASVQVIACVCLFALLAVIGGDRGGLVVFGIGEHGVDFRDIFGDHLWNRVAGWMETHDAVPKHQTSCQVDIKLLGSLNRDDLKKICGDNFPDWISFPAFEQVKWLNKELGKLWPFFAEAATVVVRESVEPLLEDYRPTGITSLKLNKFSLGTVPPKIEEITNSCIINQPKPKIEYVLKAVGGSLTALPGVSDMIDDTVNSIVTDMLQWPHRIVVPIGGIPVDTSEFELKPQGKLTVMVVKANDLKNMEMIGKSDPYALVYIRPMFKFKTHVVDNDLNPVWNQTFDLIAEDKETQSLILEVFDKDIGQDKRLGRTKLALNELEAETWKELELRLLSSFDTLKVKDKKDRGTITIKVFYHEFNKEEQLVALEEEKKIVEERKKLKEAGVIGSTMDALDGAASLLGSGVGMVGNGVGAVGSGLGKAVRFMGRTITGQSSKRSGTATPVNGVQENGGAKPL
uniref:C2 domain-containing protein n=1 Tax=Salix viminalis TaxID=40686 RepID=A0A6N2MUK9_SALVM